MPAAEKYNTLFSTNIFSSTIERNRRQYINIIISNCNGNLFKSYDGVSIKQNIFSKST